MLIDHDNTAALNEAPNVRFTNAGREKRCSVLFKKEDMHMGVLHIPALQIYSSKGKQNCVYKGMHVLIFLNEKIIMVGKHFRPNAFETLLWSKT